MSGINLSKEKIPRNWGIKRKDLEELSYYDLEHIFYGMHNLCVPAEMLDVSNPDEIAAYYIGAEKVKRTHYPSAFGIKIGNYDLDDIHETEKSIVDLFQQEKASADNEIEIKCDNHVLLLVLNAIHRFNRGAYSGSLRNASHSCRKRFAPRSQKQRIASLSNDVIIKFAKSVLQPYRASLRQEPSNPDAFYDPNCDGRSCKVYIDAIYSFLKNIYDKAHS